MTIRQCALASKAFQTLKQVYDDPGGALTRCKKKKVATIGWGVPEEMIRAHGLMPFPVFAKKDSALRQAEIYLEYSFAPKARSRFDVVMGGDEPFRADYLVISDSEDVVNRINYYLREIARQEPERSMPERYFIDLLFSRHMMYQLWTERAYERFAEQLARWAGPEQHDALAREIALSNRVISCQQELAGLRRTRRPRISGTEALIITGAGFFMDRQAYLDQLTVLKDEAGSWDEIDGIRLFYSGSVQEDTSVYEKIEACGAVVVGEDHDRGDRYYERRFREDISPIRAVTDKYMLTSPTAQKGLVTERVAYIKDAVTTSNAEAVLFYNDIYEEAASWDHPSQKKALDEIGVVSANLCKMPYPPDIEGQTGEMIRAAVNAMKGATDNG